MPPFNGEAYDAFNGDIYISDGSNLPQISVLDPDNQIIGNITALANQPTDLVYDPYNHDILVLNGNTISVINPALNNFGISGNYTLNASFTPDAISVNPLNGEIYVDGPSASGNYNVIDMLSPTFGQGTPTAENVSGVFMNSVFDPNNNDLYIVDAGTGTGNTDSLLGFNGTTLSPIPGIAYSASGSIPDALAYDADNGDIYVTDPGEEEVLVIQPGLTSGSIQTGFPTNAAASGIAFDPTDGNLYVTEELQGNDVFVIHPTEVNGVENYSFSTLTAGDDPDAVTVDTQNGDVYVADFNAQSFQSQVSVIAPAS